MMLLYMSMKLTKGHLKLTEPNNKNDGYLKIFQNDVKDDPHDTINDDMKVKMTEPLTSLS